MAGLLDYYSGLLTTDTSKGGLSATNYPAPYGLRAYMLPDGTYGGQMMPKYSGWLGEQKSIAYPDSISTELSIGDEKGDFPAMTPNLTQKQLIRLLSLKSNQKIPKDIYDTAKEFADVRRKHNQSPFKDIWDK